MNDEEEYEYGMLDDGFTGVFEEEDLSFLHEQANMALWILDHSKKAYSCQCHFESEPLQVENYFRDFPSICVNSIIGT